MGDDDKWSKLPGRPSSGQDLRLDIGYGGNVEGFRPGQGGNYGVLRNPRAQIPIQSARAFLFGSMQPLDSQVGVQHNVPDSDRWLRATAFQKGLIPSPEAPLQEMPRAEKKYEEGKVTDEEQAKQRQLKAILNNLTPQNVAELFQQVKQINIDNALTLCGVVSQIFEKALMEPTYCEMYADFCYHLAGELPVFNVDNKKITFKRLLLNKCQEEFERGEREQEEADEEGEAKQSEGERGEKRIPVRWLGNIRLIGELYKKKMLTERIMHECIKKLLGQPQNPDEEDVEALCELMSTIGEMIDHPKTKVHMNAYFDMMANLSNNMKLSSRVRFMLRDAIDLRKNKWQQRRKIEGPKKIKEVHRDAAREWQAQVRRPARTPSMHSPVRRGQPMVFVRRGSNMFSPGAHMSGFHRVSPHLCGYGARDSCFEDKHSFENRTLSFPLPQRPIGDDSITLGPQGGGLVREMSIRGSTFTQNVSSDKVFPEERLRDMSMAAIKEFYSAKDEHEVALCIRDLNAPSFYPSMISIWITDSFERKDLERDLLVKLLINLTKSEDVMISRDQLVKGFESVLNTLEDAVIDAPRAAGFLGAIFAEVILKNVIPFQEIGQLIYEGGEEQGRLVEIGLAAEVVGRILEIINSEKGDSAVSEICTSSNLRLENFRPPDSNKSSCRLDKFI